MNVKTKDFLAYFRNADVPLVHRINAAINQRGMLGQNFEPIAERLIEEGEGREYDKQTEEARMRLKRMRSGGKAASTM